MTEVGGELLKRLGTDVGCQTIEEEEGRKHKV
jgi:hypothetical protein